MLSHTLTPDAGAAHELRRVIICSPLSRGCVRRRSTKACVCGVCEHTATTHEPTHTQPPSFMARIFTCKTSTIMCHQMPPQCRAHKHDSIECGTADLVAYLLWKYLQVEQSSHTHTLGNTEWLISMLSHLTRTRMYYS